MEPKTHEQYKKIKTLGSGAYGVAYLVKGSNSGREMVIKEIDLAAMDEGDQKASLTEAKVMKLLNHPNIVKFYDVYKTKRKKLCIVMEFANGGDLNAEIKQRKKALKENNDTSAYMDEARIIKIFAMVCSALSLLHDNVALGGKKIIHRDIKSHNIFLTKDDLVKLGDFGIVRILENTKSKSETMLGTPYYFSPEMCKGEKYDEKVDVWATGVLLYEMCNLDYPFGGKNLHQLTNNIINQKYKPIPEQYSKDINNIIYGMLKKDPNQRPSINQVLKHPKVSAALKEV
jgi:NIMA (never in mitosis gene a)-related kinase